MAMVSYGRKKEERFYLDSRLKKELDICLGFAKYQDDDLVIVIDGEEGAGKSKLGRQIGKYCSLTLGTPFTVDNVHFDLNEYVDMSLEKKLYWINDLDESRKILNKKRSMGKDSVRFTNYLSECRSMRQVHILIVPSFHDLDSYVVNWRMKFLIQVLKNIVPDDTVAWGYRLERGGYVIHGKSDCRTYYNNPELRYRHPKFRKADICHFTDHEVLEEKAYKEKKQKHTVLKYHSDNVDEEILSDRSKKVLVQRNILVQYLHKLKLTQEEIGNLIGLQGSRIGQILRNSSSNDIPN